MQAAAHFKIYEAKPYKTKEKGWGFSSVVLKKN